MAQGNPVPAVYGEMRVGTRVVSQAGAKCFM